MLYDLPGVQIDSPVALKSFETFESRGQSEGRVLGLHPADALPLTGEPIYTARHKEMHIALMEEGWVFSLPHAASMGVWLSKDRDEIWTTPLKEFWQQTALLPLIRTAIECASGMEGVMSLHSACVELEGEAICFTAPSGTGKSTRAQQWVQTLGATLLSGDRPSLKLEGDGVLACGVPWDGKEQIYRNARYPLKMICLIARGEEVKAQRLSKREARQVLMQQTFLPMWDTEAAAGVMGTLKKVLDRVPVVRLQCGPDGESARQACELLCHHPERIEPESL